MWKRSFVKQDPECKSPSPSREIAFPYASKLEEDYHFDRGEERGEGYIDEGTRRRR